MKLPNVASMVALLLVVLPAVSVGIEQVFPAAEWYWSPLVVTLLGVVAKVLQETLTKPAVQPAAPPGVSAVGAVEPVVQASLVKRVMVG